jgi:Trypsin-co-occurring domain 1
VPRFAEIRLDDDTSVRLELAPAGLEAADLPGPAPQGGPDGAGRERDLPDGFSGGTPVSRGRASVLAAETLRGVLRPLGPLLQEVHDAVSAAPDRPEELSVSFGVQIGQDLKLGIVGASGQASMTVSATWRLPAREEPAQGAH